MKEPKNFLERWSRRKLEPSESDAAPSPEKISPEQNQVEPVATAFDPATLPSIESITGVSDIRAFLQKGVPQALTHAALRRVWSADPAIRDFVGLSENSWNFNNPSSIPGFGPIEPDTIQSAVEHILDESKVPAPSPPQTVAKMTESRPSAPSAMHEADAGVPTNANGKVESTATGQTEVDDAVQHKDDQTDHAALPHRHGGALPE